MRRSESKEGLFYEINIKVNKPIQKWECAIGSSIICEVFMSSNHENDDNNNN